MNYTPVTEFIDLPVLADGTVYEIEIVSATRRKMIIRLDGVKYRTPLPNIHAWQGITDLESRFIKVWFRDNCHPLWGKSRSIFHAEKLIRKGWTK